MHVAKDRIDRDEEDLVRLYLTDIGQYALLTKDDEVRLAKAIEAGKAALEEQTNAKSLNPTKKRELKKAIKEGEVAERAFVQSNLRLINAGHFCHTTFVATAHDHVVLRQCFECFN